MNRSTHPCGPAQPHPNQDGAELRANTYAVAAAWLYGLDTDRTVFYRQSDVPQCTELAWYLSCFFPYSRLTLAHSFKDKADRLEKPMPASSATPC